MEADLNILNASTALGIVDDFLTTSAQFHIGSLILLASITEKAKLTPELTDEVRCYIRYLRNFSENAPLLKKSLTVLKDAYYQ